MGKTLALAFSPDGQWFALPYESVIAVWSMEGTRRLTYTGHGESVVALAWSPDGHTLASGTLAGNVHIWDAQTGTLLFEKRYGGPIATVYWLDTTIVIHYQENSTDQIEEIRQKPEDDQKTAKTTLPHPPP